MQVLLLLHLLPIPGCAPASVSDAATDDSAVTDTAPDDSAITDTAPDDTAPDTGAPVELVPGHTYEHLGVLLIDIDGQTLQHGVEVEGWLEVVRDHDDTLNDLDDAPRTWSGPIGLELHGSSSLGYPKTNYRLELRDDHGDDTEFPLLDMAEESDWVLHGPYSDKTLIHNALAYALGRAVARDSDRWEPHTRFAELFVDGDYRGAYLVTERVKRDNHRLDLPEPGPDDLSGGYIVRIDQNRSDGWVTDLGTPIDYAYPHGDRITPAQDVWLQGYFNDLETMLTSDGWDDPHTGWPAWIDGDSFVDHYIVNEIAHNIDAYRLSAYLYKNADADGGKLFAGPLWDFDRAFANVNYCDCWQVQGFIIDDLTTCGYAYEYPPWWSILLQDPVFTTALRCRWEELRTGVLSDDALLEQLTTLEDTVAPIEARDHERWPVLGEYVDPNYYVGETWQDEIDYLHDWLMNRVGWLDANMPGACR